MKKAQRTPSRQPRWRQRVNHVVFHLMYLEAGRTEDSATLDDVSTTICAFDRHSDSRVADGVLIFGQSVYRKARGCYLSGQSHLRGISGSNTKSGFCWVIFEDFDQHFHWNLSEQSEFFSESEQSVIKKKSQPEPKELRHYACGDLLWCRSWRPH